MANFDDTPTVATPQVPNFQLTPPEPIGPVSAETARGAVPLPVDAVVAVEDQVVRFIEALLEAEAGSETFEHHVQGIEALGRAEISHAARLLRGRIPRQQFVGDEEGPAFLALQEIRQELGKLHPQGAGDLLAPHKILGVISSGTRLKPYFRQFDSAASRVNQHLSRLHAAREAMQREIVVIEATRTKLWAAMQQLAAAAHFAATLDSHLRARMGEIEALDAQRAQALRERVLAPAAQKASEILAQQAICVNGYRALEGLKKTGRELMNGCGRVASTVIGSLGTAQRVARATGHPFDAMEMLQGAGSSWRNWLPEGAAIQGTQDDDAARIASEPRLGIDKIREAFEQFDKAVDAVLTFRAQAGDVMSRNEESMQPLLLLSEQAAERLRQQPARGADRAVVAGPVAL